MVILSKLKKIGPVQSGYKKFLGPVGSGIQNNIDSPVQSGPIVPYHDLN